MQTKLLGEVIFSPGALALSLASELAEQGAEVSLYTPGPVNTKVRNVTADLTLFEAELEQRGYGYLELLKKHPLTFITLARQIQAELISSCFSAANAGEFDVVHIYTNEEEIGLAFAHLCKAPLVFTHHEPFNFLSKYRAVFPKYKHLNWISLSLAQQQTAASGTNFVANIYHGLDENSFKCLDSAADEEYLAYFGRIIEPKGVHLAIAAAKEAGIKLKIAGKHYSGHSSDNYWEEQILPHIDGKHIEYVGFIKDVAKKNEFLGNAKGLLVPSTWEEPFGMVIIEALASGTPVIGLANGAIPEIVADGETGFLIESGASEKGNPDALITGLVGAIQKLHLISRSTCRKSFLKSFTSRRMASDHLKCYSDLLRV